MSAFDVEAIEAHLIAVGLAPVRNRSLLNLTTYAVGGNATLSVTVSSQLSIRALVEVTAQHPDVPVVVIGRGSNTLISDQGFDGLVVFVSASANEATIEVEENIVNVAGSVTMPVLARRSVKAGRGGLDWCVGIPGSVGGAVRMNAGGHGAEMVDSLVAVELASLKSGQSLSVAASELGLHFRGSAVAPHHIVVSAQLLTVSREVADGQKEIDDVVSWRREHQPGGRNAGSVFVNPAPGAGSSGALIDACGLRGFAIGGAQVSAKHANFIQASDGATAQDIISVMSHVQDVVQQQHGVLLRSEVCLLGFGDDVLTRFADPRHSDGDHVTASRSLAHVMGESRE